MRRTRHVVLPVRSWQYMGLMIVSLACLTLGLVSRDREGRSGSLAGPELKHTAPHEVDACPNVHPFTRLPPYDETALQKGQPDEPGHDVRTSIQSQTSRDTRLVNINDRVSRARSLDRHGKPTAMSRDRKIDARDRRSISTDRRTRSIDMSHVRDDRFNRHNTLTRSRSFELRVRDDDMEKQRLILQSKNRRSTQEIMRSRSYGRRSVEQRVDDRSNRRNTDFLRRTVRSVSERDTRDDRFVRMSRSDSHIENRIKSNERRSSERREMSPIEFQERRKNILARSRDVRLSRSRDINRVDSRRVAVRSDERRSFERREMSPVERQERFTNVLARSRDISLSRSRDINRVDSRRVGVRADERRSFERREMSPIKRQERRIDLPARSKSRDVTRLEVRRMGIQLQERRSVEKRNRNTIERQERRMDLLATSRDVQESRSRDVARLDDGRLGEELSRQRRSIERYVRRISWVDSLRRNVPTSRNTEIHNSERRERLTARDPSRERRISTIGQTSSINSQRRNVRSYKTGQLMDFERRDHLAMRHVSQDIRGRHVEPDIHRERRTSRANDRVDVHRKRTAMINGIQTYRMDNNPEIRNERHQMNSLNIPKLDDVRNMSKTEICDYLRQTLILALCAVYGASLLKGKGGYHSFRNILTQSSRLLAW